MIFDGDIRFGHSDPLKTVETSSYVNDNGINSLLFTRWQHCRLYSVVHLQIHCTLSSVNSIIITIVSLQFTVCSVIDVRVVDFLLIFSFLIYFSFHLFL